MGGVRGLGSFEGLRCAQDGSMRLRYVERKTYASEFERRTTPMSRQGSDGCTLPYDDMRNDGKPTKPMCFNNAQMHDQDLSPVLLLTFDKMAFATGRMEVLRPL
jgi:hypothetical protein